MDIMVVIFKNIFWFVMVFVIAIVSFALMFYHLGQIQMDFDGLTLDEKDEIPYSSVGESIWYIWFLVLG